MRRYTPESTSPRNFDVIRVKLHSGLAILFRPIDTAGEIAIELTRNDEPICQPTNYAHARLRQILVALALQCRIIELRAEAPIAILGIELEDGFALTFIRGATGFYVSATEQGERLGHQTFLTVERMRRIIEELGKLAFTGAPVEPDESDSSDESDELDVPSNPNRTWN